jgi:hypothetical protein
MKISRNASFLVTLATVVGSSTWAADGGDVGNLEARFQLMSERMEQLEGELDETQGELREARDELGEARDELGESRERVDRQEQVIERAGLDRTAASGLSRFFQEVEISGWVSASWLWNFNNPDESSAGTGVNQGFDGAFYPFHPDHNSFEVNQVWFEVEKPVTEESRAGFRTSFVWGKTAGQLGAPVHRSGYVTDVDFATDEFSMAGGGDAASDFILYRAYVQYLTPIGLRIRAGKFATLLGAEVAETIYNFNITRGNVYNLLQPISHYGVIVDGSSGPFSYALGAVNRGACCGLDPDTTNAKSVLAQLRYEGGGKPGGWRPPSSGVRRPTATARGRRAGWTCSPTGSRPSRSPAGWTSTTCGTMPTRRPSAWPWRDATRLPRRRASRCAPSG